MENLELYERFRTVPDEAKRTIAGGHLKGMTDINPMLRIKQLTAAFGPMGMGWWTKNVHYTKETANPLTGEIPIFCELELWYKIDGQEYGPVYGCGGNMLIAQQRGAAYTNDEAYKMAYTDAISVACKNLGMCADVYWQSDRTKYTLDGELDAKQAPMPAKQKPLPQRAEAQAPAAITTADQLPAEAQLPQANPNTVQGYLKIEFKKIRDRFKTDDKGTMAMWKGLSEMQIEGVPAFGTPSIKLTMEQAKALISAIWENFEPAPKEQTA